MLASRHEIPCATTSGFSFRSNVKIIARTEAIVFGSALLAGVTFVLVLGIRHAEWPAAAAMALLAGLFLCFPLLVILNSLHFVTSHYVVSEEGIAVIGWRYRRHFEWRDVDHIIVLKEWSGHIGAMILYNKDGRKCLIGDPRLSSGGIERAEALFEEICAVAGNRHIPIEELAQYNPRHWIRQSVEWRLPHVWGNLLQNTKERKSPLSP